MNAKKPCVRCLLEAAGKTDIADSVKAAISRMPDFRKADDETYRKRLDICRECEYLSDGTCLKCGCYVELRAAARDGYCPDVRKKWQ